MKGTPTWKSHLLLAVLCLLLLQIALKMIRMERKWRQSPLFFRLCILWVWQHLEGVIYLVLSMPSSHTALRGLMHGLPQALQDCLYRSRKCRRFSIRAGERQQLGKEWIPPCGEFLRLFQLPLRDQSKTEVSCCSFQKHWRLLWKLLLD